MLLGKAIFQVFWDASLSNLTNNINFIYYNSKFANIKKITTQLSDFCNNTFLPALFQKNTAFLNSTPKQTLRVLQRSVLPCPSACASTNIKYSCCCSLYITFHFSFIYINILKIIFHIIFHDFPLPQF